MLTPGTDRASCHPSIYPPPIWDQVMVPPTRTSHQKIPFLHSPVVPLPCLCLANLPTRPSCVTTPDLWGRTWKVNEEWKSWNLENLAPFDAGLIIWADVGEKHSEEADGQHDSSSGETVMSLMWIVHMTSGLSCWVITLPVTVQIFVHSRVQRTFQSRSP